MGNHSYDMVGVLAWMKQQNKNKRRKRSVYINTKMVSMKGHTIDT